MSTLTATEINVTLTEAQKELFTTHIVNKRNRMKACAFANIFIDTFNKAMKGGLLKEGQRDKLIEFCKLSK